MTDHPRVHRRLAASAALALCVPMLMPMLARAASPTAGSTATETKPAAQPYKRVLEKEAASQSLCEALPDRVFVTHRQGSECIAYFVTRGSELKRAAVIYLEGDLKPEKMAADIQAKILTAQQAHLQRLADTQHVRLVAISRPGVLGSSGNHGDRRKPAEALSVGAAIDLLKIRLGIDRIVLAGQSGGSTIAASLLTMGRRDVTCAVLGSGNLSVVERHLERALQDGRKTSREAIARTFYDPAANIGSIVPDPRRRVFVIGDPKDQVTPFPQQQQFADGLRSHGHHVQVVAIAGTGAESHGVSYRSLPAAAHCALGLPDSYIVARASQPPPAGAGKPVVVESKPVPGGAGVSRRASGSI